MDSKNDLMCDFPFNRSVATGHIDPPTRVVRRRLSRLCMLAVCLIVAMAKSGRAAEFGLDGRGGHIAMPAFGRNTSLTHIELLPFLIDDSETHALFGDVRGFLTNHGELGTNLGTGYRYIEPNGVVLLGTNVWYDADHSTGKFFHQVGLGLEGRTELGGVHANFYLPVGDDNRRFQRTLINERFDGTGIVFDVRDRMGQAMRGLDVTLAAYLPGAFARDRQLEVSAGWYHFEGSEVKDIDGFKLALDGRVAWSLFSQVAVTHDGTFGTNVTLSADWRFGTKGRPDTTVEGQLRRFVDRNYNVIVGRHSVIGDPVVAVHARTGEAFRVQHVASGATGGDGTAENPWGSIAEAQTAGADVIFVHSGSTLSESIDLDDGQYLFGEGMTHRLVDRTFGQFNVPTASAGTVLPTLLDSPGHGIRLGDGSHVGGFVIDTPTGHGIIGQGVHDISISNVTIRNAGGHGLFLDDVTGSLRNVVVDDAGGSGLVLSNIDGNIDIWNLKVDGASEYGVSIIGGHGRRTFYEKTVVQNAALAGFSIDGVETTTIDGANVVGSVAVQELELTGADGGMGLRIVDSVGDLFFQKVNIETSNATAIHVRDSEAVVVGNGTVTTEEGPAADIENADVNVQLTSVNVDGGTHAVRIVDSTGRFLVFGDGKAGGGGTIQNTDVALLLQNAGQVAVQGMLFDSNGTVATVDDADVFALIFSKVTGTTHTLIDAVNLRGLEVSSSTFEENPLTSARGIRLRVDEPGSYVAVVANNEVADSAGTFFKVEGTGDATKTSLTYGFQANKVNLTRAHAVAAELDWIGPVNAVVSNNLITGSLTGQTGIKLSTGSSSEMAQLTVTQNNVTFSGTGTTAVDLKAGSPGLIQVVQNLVVFNGRDGVGIRVVGEKPIDIDVASNDIYDNAGGATGILFPTIATGSAIYLEDNYIDLSKVSLYVDRGIILSSVSGDGAPVQLISEQTNIIVGATTPYYIPSSGVTGNLLIEIK